MARSFVLIAAFLLFFGRALFAGNPQTAHQFINHKDWSFVENKGQLTDQDGKFISRVVYYSHEGGANIYCQPGKISFVFTKTENLPTQISEATGAVVGFPLPKGAGGFGEKNIKTTTNRVDLILLHSNPATQITATDKQEYYENFYTSGDANYGITNVHTYKTIIYKNIYDHIDMVLHVQEGGMKYEFVVYPGGKVSDIQMQWAGLNSIKKLKDSKIEYSFPLGNMTESAPYTYVEMGMGKPGIQKPGRGEPCPYNVTNVGAALAVAHDANGTPTGAIESHFILEHNRVGFKVGKYDKRKVLVIDPTLLWGTYFGGSGDEWAGVVAVDDSNNVYITGQTTSPSNIATSGAYETSYIAGISNSSFTCSGGNVYLAKFNSKGNLMWATYYAGGCSGSLGIATDKSNGIFITGNTLGGNGIATKGAYQTSYAGGYGSSHTNSFGDVFIAKFDGNGKIQWGTFFGGPGEDYGLSIAADKLGNVCITGFTESSTGIATKGAFQTSNGGSNEIAFLAKFSGNGNIQWATYYGTTWSEDGYGVCMDDSDNVYIVGATSSPFGLATPGAYQTSCSGGGHVFLAKFNGLGIRQWGTYFAGEKYEDGHGITIDFMGNIYITGFTVSRRGIATKGAYQFTLINDNSHNSGNEFLAKFNNNGMPLWATYFGLEGTTFSGENGANNSITTDRYGNVYFTGQTQTAGLATSDAYKSTFAGKQALFIAEFNTNGKIRWSSYYGGGENDLSCGIAVDYFGSIYISGYTSSHSSIATNGAYQTVFSGPNSYSTDGFLVKFGNNYDAGIASFISPYVTNSCKDTFPIIVSLKNYGLLELEGVKIGLSINGKLQKPYQWAGKLQTDSSTQINLGNYSFIRGANTIKAWTYDPNATADQNPFNDTMSIMINVYPLPTPSAGPDTLLCYDQEYTMQGAGGITYTWRPAIYLSSASDPHAKAILPNTERYTLIVQNKYGCIDSATVLARVRPKLSVKTIKINEPICPGQQITIHTKADGGDSAHYSFLWPNDSLHGRSLIKKVFRSAWHTVILNDGCSGLPAIDSLFIPVTPLAHAAFIWSPSQRDIVNRPIRFQNQSSDAVSYLWTFGAKDSSKNTSPVYFYNDTGKYKVMLIAYSQNHCPSDTFYSYINIISDKVSVYIPNALSPNGDGVNDVFDISGTGIASYSYNIYNRWGEIIFNGKGAWDGKYKGQKVPEGIYIYQLELIDTDGYSHHLSGNITVLK